MKISRLLLILILLWAPLPSMAEPANFTLSDAEGDSVSLADYRGRWVIINFWASWCAPCIKEIPEFIQFQEKYPKIQIIGINFEQQTPVQLRNFLKKFEVNYPQLMVKHTPLVPFEPLKGLPTTAIVDPKGELISKHTGPVTLEMLEHFFQKEKVIADPRAEQRAKELARAKAEAEARAKQKETERKAIAQANRMAAKKARIRAKARARAKAKAKAKKKAALKKKRKAAAAKKAAEAKAKSTKKSSAKNSSKSNK